MTARLIACLACAVGLLRAQAPEWTPPASEAAAKPNAACQSLRALTGFEFTVVTATLQPASGATPEFCRVLGQVQPEIRFEVALPAAWNKRLLMVGNGGYAGENIESPGRAAQRDSSLRMGFVAAQTNTGHDAAQEPLGSFAVNHQKLFDYAFRAVHVTAETAKRLAAAYYGRAPERSYFLGCSTGGRQALIAAQRFPGDFDGIFSGAPVLDFTGTMMKYVTIERALAAAPIPGAKLRLLADRVYGVCDEKDGVKDGLIEDPRKCGFEPSRDLPKCAGAEAADCFTEGQVRTLETIYRDVTVNGQRVFAGWPVGAEIAGQEGRSGWDRWLVSDKPPTVSTMFAETFFRFLAFPKKDPNLTLSQVDLERDAPQLAWIHGVLDATDTDLSAFRDRGGKLLMWFGWADPALNPMMGVEYYEAVLRKMGAGAQESFRLYMAPGVFHCGGGVGCDSFPRLKVLIDWVEQGKKPETIEAARIVKGERVRTRPLCPYPQVAKYKGSGSIDAAQNFACAPN